MTTLICDCNQTQPLDPKALGQSLSEPLTLHTALCRRDVGAYLQAIQGNDDVVVACTQEQRLFSDLAVQTNAKTSVIKFVNIRETGGWSRDAKNASPKIAALLAAAHLPEPDPVPTVTYKSNGRLLIIGTLDVAEPVAALLADNLQVTVFTQGDTSQLTQSGNAKAEKQTGLAISTQNRSHPVLGGEIVRLDGWLGAFKLTWKRSNPIDLDVCTRCNACVAACPEQAIGLDYQVDLSLCTAHRDCVKVCEAAGAIDFTREARQQNDRFDVVLDSVPETLTAQVMQATQRRGVNLVYDHLGGAYLTACMRSLSAMGLAISYNIITGKPDTDVFGLMRELLSKSLGVRCFSMHTFDENVSNRRSLMNQAIDLMASQKVKAPPATIMSFNEVVQAHIVLDSGATLGKIVLNPH